MFVKLLYFIWLLQFTNSFYVKPFLAHWNQIKCKKNYYMMQSIEKNTKNNDLYVMINGLPGPMALETAKSCLNRGYNLCPIGFTGASGKVEYIDINGLHNHQQIKLVSGPGLNRDALNILKQLKENYPNIIIVDYTHPNAALSNIQTYIQGNIDFVMGTTGLEKEIYIEEFKKGNITAVIAPNMGKQIVALQAGILAMTERFPNSFEDYELTVRESHQSKKADTSGTAKAIVSSLSILNGKKMDVDDIKMIRDVDEQIVFGVPKDALDGHAFHTYTFTSPDKR